MEKGNITPAGNDGVEGSLDLATQPLYYQPIYCNPANVGPSDDLYENAGNDGHAFINNINSYRPTGPSNFSPAPSNLQTSSVNRPHYLASAPAISSQKTNLIFASPNRGACVQGTSTHSLDQYLTTPQSHLLQLCGNTSVEQKQSVNVNLLNCEMPGRPQRVSAFQVLSHSPNSSTPTGLIEGYRPEEETTFTEASSQINRKKRKACGRCGPCQRKDNCGTCMNCINRAKGKQICVYRKCEELRKKPKVENPSRTRSAFASPVDCFTLRQDKRKDFEPSYPENKRSKAVEQQLSYNHEVNAPFSTANLYPVSTPQLHFPTAQSIPNFESHLDTSVFSNQKQIFSTVVQASSNTAYQTVQSAACKISSGLVESSATNSTELPTNITPESFNKDIGDNSGNYHLSFNPTHSRSECLDKIQQEKNLQRCDLELLSSSKRPVQSPPHEADKLILLQEATCPQSKVLPPDRIHCLSALESSEWNGTIIGPNSTTQFLKTDCDKKADNSVSVGRDIATTNAQISHSYPALDTTLSTPETMQHFGPISQAGHSNSMQYVDQLQNPIYQHQVGHTHMQSTYQGQQFHSRLPQNASVTDHATSCLQMSMPQQNSKLSQNANSLNCTSTSLGTYVPVVPSSNNTFTINSQQDNTQFFYSYWNNATVSTVPSKSQVLDCQNPNADIFYSTAPNTLSRPTHSFSKPAPSQMLGINPSLPPVMHNESEASHDTSLPITSWHSGVYQLQNYSQGTGACQLNNKQPLNHGKQGQYHGTWQTSDQSSYLAQSTHRDTNERTTASIPTSVSLATSTCVTNVTDSATTKTPTVTPKSDILTISPAESGYDSAEVVRNTEGVLLPSSTSEGKPDLSQAKADSTSINVSIHGNITNYTDSKNLKVAPTVEKASFVGGENILAHQTPVPTSTLPAAGAMKLHTNKFVQKHDTFGRKRNSSPQRSYSYDLTTHEQEDVKPVRLRRFSNQETSRSQISPEWHQTFNLQNSCLLSSSGHLDSPQASFHIKQKKVALFDTPPVTPRSTDNSTVQQGYDSSNEFFPTTRKISDILPTPPHVSEAGFLKQCGDHNQGPADVKQGTTDGTARPKTEFPPCDCIAGTDGRSSDAPYYTHLGAADSVQGIRKLFEKRTGYTGNAIRIEKVIYTGKEGKTSTGCPMAKWIIRRSGEEEKVLIVCRQRPGHSCPTAVIVVIILIWDGVARPLADFAYDTIKDYVPKHGEPTERRCATNDDRTCACQGFDESTCGASFSFGCSWSMYYNGCKYARSHNPNKFKLTGTKDPEAEKFVGSLCENLATAMSAVYEMAAPDAFANQVRFEENGSECRLGASRKLQSRPFSGVTSCMDFCAHSHKDQHNMDNGSTVVITLTRPDLRTVGGKHPNEQLHVLPLCKLDISNEQGSDEGIAEKISSGVIEKLDRYHHEVRLRDKPKLSKKQKVRAKKKISDSGESPPFKRRPGRPSKGSISTMNPLDRYDDDMKIYQGQSFPTPPRNMNIANLPSQQPHPQFAGPLSPTRWPYRRHMVSSFPSPSPIKDPSTSSSVHLLDNLPSIGNFFGPNSSNHEGSAEAPNHGVPSQFCHADGRLESVPQLKDNVTPQTPVMPLSQSSFESPSRDQLGVNSIMASSSHSGSPVFHVTTPGGLSTGGTGEILHKTPSPVCFNSAGSVTYSDSEENFLDSDIGGVAVAPGHGSVLFECAKRELHATTAVHRPNRFSPSRISLVFYQHKSMNSRNHGSAEYEAKEEERKKQKEKRTVDIQKEQGSSAMNKIIQPQFAVSGIDGPTVDQNFPGHFSVDSRRPPPSWNPVFMPNPRHETMVQGACLDFSTKLPYGAANGLTFKTDANQTRRILMLQYGNNPWNGPPSVRSPGPFPMLQTPHSPMQETASQQIPEGTKNMYQPLERLNVQYGHYGMSPTYPHVKPGNCISASYHAQRYSMQSPKSMLNGGSAKALKPELINSHDNNVRNRYPAPQSTQPPHRINQMMPSPCTPLQFDSGHLNVMPPSYGVSPLGDQTKYL